MQKELLHQTGNQRAFAVVLETGEEALVCLQQFACGQQIRAAQITSIGATARPWPSIYALL